MKVYVSETAPLSTDSFKIGVVRSYIHSDRKQFIDQSTVVNYDDMCTMLMEFFGKGDTKVTAESAIEKATHGKNETVQALSSRLGIHFSRLEYTDQQMISKLYSKINAATKKKIFSDKMEWTPAYLADGVAYHDWVQRVQNRDEHLRLLNTGSDYPTTMYRSTPAAKTGGWHQPPPTPPQALTSCAPPCDPDAMDVDAQKGRPIMSRKDAFDKGLCRYCGGKWERGHTCANRPERVRGVTNEELTKILSNYVTTGTPKSNGTGSNLATTQIMAQDSTPTQRPETGFCNEFSINAMHMSSITLPVRLRRTTGTQVEKTVYLSQMDTEKRVKATALIDSGCTTSCINKDFVEQHGGQIHELRFPMPAVNADGTVNSGGPITHYCVTRITIDGHNELVSLPVVNLGRDDIFLGYDWLYKHDPKIRWRTGEVKFT